MAVVATVLAAEEETDDRDNQVSRRPRTASTLFIAFGYMLLTDILFVFLQACVLAVISLAEAHRKRILEQTGGTQYVGKASSDIDFTAAHPLRRKPAELLDGPLPFGFKAQELSTSLHVPLLARDAGGAQAANSLKTIPANNPLCHRGPSH
jgi:hypothetical protein